MGKVAAPSIFSAVLAVVVAIASTGCRTHGYVKSDNAARSAYEAADAARSEGKALDATVHSLNDLVSKPTGNLGAQFDQFSQSLDVLADSNKIALQKGTMLDKNSAIYFDSWATELTTLNNEQIRKSSSSRRDEVIKQYQDADRRYIGAHETLTPLIGYLQDVRKSLSTDLTTGGLTAAQSIARNATDRSATAQTALQQAATAMQGLGASRIPSGGA